MLLLIISFTFSSCFHSNIIWKENHIASDIEEAISFDEPHGVFEYTKKKNNRLILKLRFGFYEGQNGTTKTTYSYNTGGKLIEEIRYGYPFFTFMENDTLGTSNKYPLDSNDKAVIKRISLLEKNDSFHILNPVGNPLTLSHIYKIRSYQYDYNDKLILRKDSIYNYEIYENYRYKGESDVYQETIGRYKEPELIFNYCLFKKRNNKIIQCETKKIKEGKR